MRVVRTPFAVALAAACAVALPAAAAAAKPKLAAKPVTVRGVVVARQQARGTLVVATAKGAVATLRTSAARRVGAKIAVRATQLADGTYGAGSIAGHGTAPAGQGARRRRLLGEGTARPLRRRERLLGQPGARALGGRRQRRSAARHRRERHALDRLVQRHRRRVEGAAGRPGVARLARRDDLLARVRLARARRRGGLADDGRDSVQHRAALDDRRRRPRRAARAVRRRGLHARLDPGRPRRGELRLRHGRRWLDRLDGSTGSTERQLGRRAGTHRGRGDRHRRLVHGALGSG